LEAYSKMSIDNQVTVDLQMVAKMNK